MKSITTLILSIFVTLSFAQVSTSKLKAVPIIENRTYQLDGNAFIVFGQSRVIIPIELPENTKEWYYIFSSFSDKEVARSNSATIDLLGQLSLIIDQTGTTADAISFLFSPSGSSNCNVYLFPGYSDAKNFLNKTDQELFPSGNWQYRVHGSILAATQGKEVINDVDAGTYYLGIQAGTSPVIVKIEVAAIVDEINTDMTSWSADMTNMITDIVKNELIKAEVSELIATELAVCITDNITKNYTPIVFFDFAESVINKIVDEYYTLCSNKIDGTETEEQKKALTYGNLGWEHYQNGNIDKAIDYSKKALELHKDLGWVQTNLGLFYFIKGDDVTATDFYIDAIIDLKADKLRGKGYLKAAIDDITNAHNKYPEMKGYEAVLAELKREYDNF